MKTAKFYVVNVGAILFFCASVITIMGISLYQSIDGQGNKVSADVRMVPVLLNLKDQVKTLQSAEHFEEYFKSIDSSLGVKTGAYSAAEVRKLYAPVLKHLKEKPGDGDLRTTQIKKKDFLDATLNFYRKEVPSGEIPVRAVLLNIIFDTHASFLGETPEMEQVYIKKCHEKIASLKTIANEARSPGIGYRISGIDNLLSAYEKSANLRANWDIEHQKLLAEAEKGANQMLSQLKQRADMSDGSAQRDFLQNIIIAAAVIFLSFVLLLWGANRIQGRFDGAALMFKRFMQKYGMEKVDLVEVKDIATLKNDANWGPLFRDVFDLEEKFIKTFEREKAVSEYIPYPLVVATRSGEIEWLNDRAKGLFSTTGQSCTNLKTLVTTDCFGSEAENVYKTIEECGQNEFELVANGIKTPLEISSYKITKGKNLLDGRVIVFRPIPDEMLKVQKKLDTILDFTKTAGDRIFAGAIVSSEIREANIPVQVKEIVNLLETKKMAQDEKALHWKSEAQALQEQVARQKEILTKGNADIKEVQIRSAECSKGLQELLEAETDLIRQLEDLDQKFTLWQQQESRIEKSVRSRDGQVSRIGELEHSLRDEVSEMGKKLESLQNDLDSLFMHREEVKLKALNLSLGREPGSEILASRARSYSQQLEKICEKLESLFAAVDTYVNKNLAASPFALVETNPVDVSMFEELKADQTKMQYSVREWKSKLQSYITRTPELRESAEVARARAEDLEKMNSTSLLINEKASENLVRWN